ncbi:hypothetical protein JHK86_053072 [Glycine max]|nr:hypothetical protein JHK86_053072 [Glycine max]
MENIFFEEEKMIFAQLPDKYVKTKALLEASNQHKQLLCEQGLKLAEMHRVAWAGETQIT